MEAGLLWEMSPLLFKAFFFDHCIVLKPTTTLYETCKRSFLNQHPSVILSLQFPDDPWLSVQMRQDTSPGWHRDRNGDVWPHQAPWPAQAGSHLGSLSWCISETMVMLSQPLSCPLAVPGTDQSSAGHTGARVLLTPLPCSCVCDGPILLNLV